MTLDDVFQAMPHAFVPDAANGIDATITFACSTPRHVVIRDGELAVSDGAADSSTLTVTMEDEDLRQMLIGELDGMTAFMSGKIQIDGDMLLAQQMGNFFDMSKVG